MYTVDEVFQKKYDQGPNSEDTACFFIKCLSLKEIVTIKYNNRVESYFKAQGK
jgi:hypothetical protein